MRERFDGFEVRTSSSSVRAIKDALSTPGVKIDEVARADGLLTVRISAPEDLTVLRKDIIDAAARSERDDRSTGRDEMFAFCSHHLTMSLVQGNPPHPPLSGSLASAIV